MLPLLRPRPPLPPSGMLQGKLLCRSRASMNEDAPLLQPAVHNSDEDAPQLQPAAKRQRAAPKAPPKPRAKGKAPAKPCAKPRGKR